MKATFVLLLCGLSYALGKFDCNQSYPKECIDLSAKDYGIVEDFYPENEADLEDFCKIALKELKCQIDFSIECPRTLTGAFRRSYEDLLKTFNRICNKKDPLHHKYLEKISGLNKEIKLSERECEGTVKEQEYCKRFFEVLRCTEDEVIKKCGKDGEELVTELFKQKHSMNRVFCP